MLHLFEKFGIELEYMIVREDDHSVAPIADRLIADFCGAPLNECEVESCGVSNELAAHVIELKTPEPAADFAAMEAGFTAAVGRINKTLSLHSARLLPGPMHPTLDPATESFTWPHEGQEIYSLYDSIFNCRGHGWFNLQSCHINLPFAGDREFALLHSAVILLLPLMPALTAGSPFLDGRISGLADTRLDIYQHNQDRCPSITGLVIPEPAFSQTDYRKTILEPMYREIAPFDPSGILGHEWLNSRGAITRFDRNAIEIRLLDVQECPAADLALAQFIIAALRRLAEDRGSSLGKLVLRSPTREKKRQLQEVIRNGMDAPLIIPELRDAFDLPGHVTTAGGFWRYLFDSGHPDALPEDARAIVDRILRVGNLSTRLIAAHRQRDAPAGFRPITDSLAACLAENRLFDASPHRLSIPFPVDGVRK